MHLRVDCERGAVDHRVAFDHLAGVVDADQVGDTDVLEVHPERVDPEAVEVFGIAHGDVPGDPLVESELAEQAERRREALLAVQAFLLHGIECGEEGQVGKQCSHAEILGLLSVVGRTEIAAGPVTVHPADCRLHDTRSVTLRCTTTHVRSERSWHGEVVHRLEVVVDELWLQRRLRADPFAT